MKRIYILICIFILVCFVPSAAFAQGYLEKVNIHQVENKDDAFTAYISFSDDVGLPFNDIEADNIKADINDVPLKVKDITSFEESEEGVTFLFLVDVSGSVSGKMFSEIKQSMNDWISNMDYNDFGAIISFGQNIEEVAEFTDDTGYLEEMVDTLKAEQDYTRLNEGMSSAIYYINDGPQYLPQRKVIVVLSDGEDTTNKKNDETNESILQILKQSDVPVYSIGCNYSKNKGNDKHLLHLQNMSDASNGLYFDLEDNDIEYVYSNIRQTISETFVVDLVFDDTSKLEKSDEYVMTIKVIDGLGAATDAIEVDVDEGYIDSVVAENKTKVKPNTDTKPMPKPTPIKQVEPELIQETETEQEPLIDEEESGWTAVLMKYWWIIASFLLLVLASLTVLFVTKKKRQNEVVDVNPSVSFTSGVKTMAKPEPSEVKPIDPAHIDSLRAKTVVGAVDTQIGKGIMVTIQKPKSDLIECEAVIQDTLTLGKSADCDIVIDDDLVSDKQIQISYRNGFVYIMPLDLDSESFVNGMEFKVERQLKSGDYINVGSCLIQVKY